jgi:dCTP deaminase
MCHEYDAVAPYDDKAIQPASIDLKLGTSFRVFSEVNYSEVGSIFATTIDLADYRDHSKKRTVPVGRSLIIMPGEFLLGSTLEKLRIPDQIAMYLDGKSSIGRLGLSVHVTAGYFDPGFEGVGTLELVNFGPYPIRLRPGLFICQSRWLRLSGIPNQTYQGRYHGDMEAVASRYSG